MSSRPGEPGPDRPTASVLTLGCKVNQFESAAISRTLNAAGYRFVPKGRPADLRVINTCTVTHRADVEVRNLIRRADRANPKGRTVVTGCLAQLRPEEMAALPGVALVAGQNDKADFLKLISGIKTGFDPVIRVSPLGRGHKILDLGFPDFERTRAFFRIQDGCSAACAYCVIPRSRGPSRSLEPDQVFKGVGHYGQAGYNEVVLTGIHLGAWGLDLTPPSDLTGLLKRLAGPGTGPRLRISSMEPNEVTGEMVRLIRSNPRFCPHLHLALQSGSDQVLAAMGRPYTASFFQDLTISLTADRPDFCLGADVLIGFPGEDEAAFAQTMDLAAELPLAYLHVFSFSRRPHTRAASMPGQVPADEIKRRVKIMREMSQAKRRAFFERCLGRVRPALIENTKDRATGLSRGLTDNYIQVLVSGPAPAAGEIAPMRLMELTPDGRVLAKAG
ncbi:MAG: tRNA (N(6)-L-threonylcarbamoyladenosine(37)-C(2))-methylthiotransferase MtaB [Thermodesulfobacteriota bacterium]|nr:tRNA (N(6)-L-threonylcarbamoyladenosine(37)-C(2))-methylthiotransferase MtaB [Thermodesulfobacteriota bacterium]